ncbi:hypothetical protein D3C86_1331400 [compost metagenome]
MFSNVRHGYTTGVRETEPGDSRPSYHGQTAFTKVIGGTGFNCQTACFDTHSDGSYIDFIGCTAVQPYVGPAGASRCFQLRGRHNRVIDSKSIGGIGVVAYADYASAENSRDHSVINHYHEYQELVTQNTAAYRIQGQSGGAISGLKFTNCESNQQNGTYQHYEFSFATDAFVDGPKIRAKKSGSGNIITLANSTCKFKEGFVDYTGAAGANNDIVDIADASSSIIWSGRLDIKTGGVLRSLVDVNSTNAKAIFEYVDFDNAPSDGDAITNLGAGVVEINYVVDGARVSTRASIALTWDTTGNKQLARGNRGAPVLLAKANTTAVSVVLNNIDAGSFIGQQLALTNATASTQPFDVSAAGTRISIGPSNITVAAGASIRLAWDGTNWIRA